MLTSGTSHWNNSLSVTTLSTLVTASSVSHQASGTSWLKVLVSPARMPSSCCSKPAGPDQQSTSAKCFFVHLLSTSSTCVFFLLLEGNGELHVIKHWRGKELFPGVPLHANSLSLACSRVKQGLLKLRNSLAGQMPCIAALQEVKLVGAHTVPLVERIPGTVSFSGSSVSNRKPSFFDPAIGSPLSAILAS